jgi:hypothetical protein
MTNDLLIYGENIRAFPHIIGSPSSYMREGIISCELLAISAVAAAGVLLIVHKILA